MRNALSVIIVVVVSLNCALCASDLVVQLPAGVTVKAAIATPAGKKPEVAGKAQGQSVTFADVLPDTPYDVKLTLPDGAVVQGVDLAWQDPDPKNRLAEPLNDDDREQVRAIVQDVKDFYNKKDVLILQGDHDHAAGLLRLVRDTDFYAGTGQVIWRIEVWYFNNEAGGWAAVAQQNKIIRRERFKDAESYKAATQGLRWVPRLGGLRVAKGTANPPVAVTKEDLAGVETSAGPKTREAK